MGKKKEVKEKQGLNFLTALTPSEQEVFRFWLDSVNSSLTQQKQALLTIDSFIAGIIKDNIHQYSRAMIQKLAGQMNPEKSVNTFLDMVFTNQKKD